LYLTYEEAQDIYERGKEYKKYRSKIIPFDQAPVTLAQNRRAVVYTRFEILDNNMLVTTTNSDFSYKYIVTSYHIDDERVKNIIALMRERGATNLYRKAVYTRKGLTDVKEDIYFAFV